MRSSVPDSCINLSISGIIIDPELIMLGFNQDVTASEHGLRMDIALEWSKSVLSAGTVLIIIVQEPIHSKWRSSGVAAPSIGFWKISTRSCLAWVENDAWDRRWARECTRLGAWSIWMIFFGYLPQRETLQSTTYLSLIYNIQFNYVEKLK